MTTYHLTRNGEDRLCGAGPLTPAIHVTYSGRELDSGAWCRNCQKVQRGEAELIRPDSSCKACHGSGEVVDWVPYGYGNTAMRTLCECVTDQQEDDRKEIVLDLSE